MASHQLRTPLTSIKGYLSMVLEGDVGEVAPQQKDMLNTAYTSAQRMVYLISDLLNVSRMQTGKFVIEPVDCYLPDVVSEELAQLKEAIASKNITVLYDKPSVFPTLTLLTAVR
jgi:signal transduction histidine kinase